MFFSSRFITISILLCLAVLTVCATAGDYVLGEGDVVKITVYGHQDLDTVERVAGDGKVNFPLLGRIAVTGLTVSQVSSLIAKGLADGYIVSPQVSVFINEFRSQKAVIMGEVSKPGLYELKGPTTLLELISQAGGLTRDAGATVSIKRKNQSKNGNREEVVNVDLAALISGGGGSEDIQVRDGDSYFVEKAGMFYVTGEVKKPDAYKFTDGTTVIKAITMAGGFTEKAAPKRVRLIRKIDGKEQVYEGVHMDELIFPDDVVVVPESYF